MPPAISESVLAAISDAIFAGKKIEAIKLYREATGLGLKESKEAVERLERDLRATAPEKFRHPAGAKGCTALLAFAAVFVIGSGVTAWCLIA